MKHCHSLARLPGLAVVLLLTCPIAGLCQPSPWENIGPEGGPIAAIAQDRFDGKVIYAAAAGSPAKIFKTTDGGEHWVFLSTVYWNVFELIIPRAAPATIVANGRYYIYRSTDGGTSWSTLMIPSSPHSFIATDIAIDPADPQIIHVAAEGWTGSRWVMSYLKSTNGGSTWLSADLLSDTSTAWALDVDPLDPQVVYVGGYHVKNGIWTGKLMKSTDGGNTFGDISAGVTGYVYSICADSAQPGRVFVGTYAGVHRSTDGGSTWSQAYIPTPYYFQVNPANSSEVYAGTASGVYKSTNGGGTWSRGSGGIQGSGVGGLVLDPATPLRLYFTNTVGVYRSTNGGASWTSCNSGIIAANITAIGCAPSSPTTVFCAFYGNAVYKTSAATAPTVLWERLPQFYDCQNLEEIVVLPTDPNVIYAMEGGG